METSRYRILINIEPYFDITFEKYSKPIIGSEAEGVYRYKNFSFITPLNVRSLLILPCIVLFIACNNESKHDEKLTNLTKNAWVLKKLESRENSAPWIDITGSLSTCMLDDELVFKTDQNYEISEAATKCDPGDPQVKEAGDWQFLNNEMEIGFGDSTYEIEILSAAQLVLVETVAGPMPSYVRFSYLH